MSLRRSLERAPGSRAHTLKGTRKWAFHPPSFAHFLMVPPFTCQRLGHLPGVSHGLYSYACLRGASQTPLKRGGRGSPRQCDSRCCAPRPRLKDLSVPGAQGAAACSGGTVGAARGLAVRRHVLSGSCFRAFGGLLKRGPRELGTSGTFLLLLCQGALGPGFCAEGGPRSASAAAR